MNIFKLSRVTLAIFTIFIICSFIANTGFAASRTERQQVISSINSVISKLNMGSISEEEAIKEITAIVPKPKNYPKRNIEFIIPWGEGGGSDRYARSIGREAAKFLPKSLIFRNMPGASGEVGYAYVLTQPSDGYTLYGMVSPNIINDALGETPYHFTEETTYIITNQGPSEVFWARSDDSRFNKWQDVVDYAKKNPGKLVISASATKSDDEFMLVQLQEQLGIKITHLASNKSGQRQANLLGGHADLLHESVGPVMDLYRGGKIKPILYNGSKRFAEIDPDVPCAKDVGLNLTIMRFRGIVGPPGIKEEIAEYLYYVFYAASKMPEYKKFEKASSLQYSQPWDLGLEDFENLCKNFKKTAQGVIDKYYK
ncbi:MAG TPA: tripartite tricarboxylate transporter substrate binding protein [Syntrophales bacterium]|nr:tripartite tricarboxylate transporter substrate binding protein [Syntrophales bacterium]